MARIIGKRVVIRVIGGQSSIFGAPSTEHGYDLFYEHAISHADFALLMCLSSTSRSQQDGAALARVGMMRVCFQGFDEVVDPETKRKEYVFQFSFIDIAIPKQPLVLRRGDRVAGYEIGTFIKREPRQLPADGIAPGTVSTLEIIHVESGEKHVLEPGRVYVVTRDR